MNEYYVNTGHAFKLSTRDTGTLNTVGYVKITTCVPILTLIQRCVVRCLKMCQSEDVRRC